MSFSLMKILPMTQNDLLKKPKISKKEFKKRVENESQPYKLIY